MADLVQQARAAMEGVTPGPWHMQKDAEAGIGEGYFVSGGGYCRADMVGPAQDRCSNARFIAASRVLVPAMADEIERLRAALVEIARLTRFPPHVAGLHADGIARRALGEDFQ